MKTFAKGLHLEYHKQSTQDRGIIETPLPQRAILPLQQNLGCAAEAIVKVGDEVFEGQKIADSTKFVSAPIHASISGKVTAVTPAIIIESHESRVTSHEFKRPETRDLEPETIRKIVREAGIVGLGGAAFPTHVKLTPPKDKKIDTLIINGCECEPYITADHRIMLERAEDVIFGARVIAKAVGAEMIIIAVEDNKKDAVNKLETFISGTPLPLGEGIGVRVISLKTKYPQGGEKQLIKAVLNREVPSGGLPFDVGVVVQNVGTAVAIAEAIKFNKPLTQRVVTVTGSGVKKPQNILARIGTTFKDAIDQCGGITEDAARVIMGGPMTGITVSSLNAPILKATNCILVLNRNDAMIFEEQSCIRCGRCIKFCPIGLLPNFIADYAKINNWDKTEEYNVTDCIECGCCAYVCPSRINLVQYFKVAKRELQLRKVICQ